QPTTDNRQPTTDNRPIRINSRRDAVRRPSPNVFVFFKAQTMTAERLRLGLAREGKMPWKKWGPYLSERQGGTVREDYSENGEAWKFWTHEHARWRASRRGVDGLAGISDDQQQLCFALVLWNENDPILKERLFGVTNSEGNHGDNGAGLGASHQTGWTGL